MKTWVERLGVVFPAIALATFWVAAACVAGAASVKGQTMPGGETHSPVAGSGKFVVLANGFPALELQGPYQRVCYIYFGHLEGDTGPAIEFGGTYHDTAGRQEYGSLILTASRIVYEPKDSRYQSSAFAVGRSEASGLEVQTGRWDLSLQVHDRKYNFLWCGGEWWLAGPPRGSHPSKEERRAQEALIPQAGQLWTSWFKLALSDFGTAVEKFRASIADLSLPLTSEVSTEVDAKERAVDSAAEAGKLYDALQDYEAALQALPAHWVPRNIMQPLREKIIKLVLRMDPRPAIPQEAMQHLAYAETAFQEAKGPADLDNAIHELNQALRLAPWWGDAYKNLGLLLEKENRYAEAASILQLYLLATPNGPDAQSVQMKIYSLQYKAKQQGTSN